MLSALIETQIFGAAELAASVRGVNRSLSLHAVIIPPALTAKVIPAVFCRKRRLVNPREVATLVISTLRGRLLDGLNNHGVGAATAQVCAHLVNDFLSARVGVASEQARRPHYLARLAITALCDLKINPGFLQRMIGRFRQALNRRDLFVRYRRHRCQAGIGRLAIDMHRTGATLTDTTAEFGAGQFEVFAQHPQ